MMSRWIYTLRTKHDMAVFYVGCCDVPNDRVKIHSRSSATRPVTIRIRENLAAGIDMVTVFEERIFDSDDYHRHWSRVELDYINGYAKLLGDKLTNVSGNRHRTRKDIYFTEAMALR